MSSNFCGHQVFRPLARFLHLYFPIIIIARAEAHRGCYARNDETVEEGRICKCGAEGFYL